MNLNFFGHSLENRFSIKNKIPDEFATIFQWKAFERAYRKTHERDKISRFKLIHAKWATNMHQASWDCNKNPHCQRCCDREETMEHIFSCTSDNASRIFKKNLTTFRASLRKCNTAPLIINAFENIILQTRKGYEVPLKDNVLHTKEMNQLVHLHCKDYLFYSGRLTNIRGRE